MKTIRLIFFMCLFLSFMGTSRLFAQQISIDFFYDKLAPYGHWAEMDELGWVWQPASVATTWRPYSDGYWVNTSEGWSFNSNTPWSWAVYHYGRWSFQDNYGWVWIPGTVWAPAWVAWRKSDKYVGWAALPPKAEWSKDDGLQTSQIDWDTDINWSSWCFVEPVYFADKEVFNHLQSTSRNPILMNETYNITSYSSENNHIVDNSLPAQEIERSTNTKISTYNIVETNNYQENVSRQTSNQIYIYRPIIVRNTIVKTPVNYITNQIWTNRDEQLRREEKERRRANRQMEWQVRQYQRMRPKLDQNTSNNNSNQNTNFNNLRNRANSQNSNTTNENRINPNFNHIRNTENRQNANYTNNTNNTNNVPVKVNENKPQDNQNFNRLRNRTNDNNLNNNVNKVDNNEIQRRNNRANEEAKRVQQERVRAVAQERRQQNHENKKSTTVTPNKEKEKDKDKK